MSFGTVPAAEGRGVRWLRRARPWLARPAAFWGIVGLAVLLCVPALFVGFATDDHVLRMVFQGFPGLPEFERSPFETFRFFFEQDPVVRDARMERGLIPWWTGDTMRMSFMRPLTSASHYLDHLAFGETAWLMHLHSLLWFAGCAILAGLLYRRLMPAAWVAGLALALYALDDARGLSAGWLSGRNALLTTFFGLAALAAHVHWRGAGKRAGLPLALLMVTLGLLSGEAALGIGGYLFAYALFLDPAGFRRGFAALLPYALIVGAWAVAYRHFGFGAAGSDGYANPLGEPLHFAKYVVLHLPVLLFGQFVLPDSTFYNFLPAPLARVYWMLAVACVGTLIWLFLPILRERRDARFWALGAVLAALPTCAVTPQDRLLGLVGLGGAGVIAIFLSEALERAAWAARSVQWRRAAAWAVPAMLALHLMLSPVALSASSYAIALVERGGQEACEALPVDGGVGEDAVIFVNVLSDLMGVGLPIMRSSQGQPVPRHTWMLAATDQTVHIERSGERTLVVTLDGGFLHKPWANLFRRVDQEPMHAGDRVELSRMTAEVLDDDGAGRPVCVRFTFDAPLEDSSFRWYAWRDGRFTPYMPPPVGGKDFIEGTQLARLLGGAAAQDERAAFTRENRHVHTAQSNQE